MYCMPATECDGYISYKPRSSWNSCVTTVGFMPTFCGVSMPGDARFNFWYRKPPWMRRLVNWPGLETLCQFTRQVSMAAAGGSGPSA